MAVEEALDFSLKKINNEKSEKESRGSRSSISPTSTTTIMSPHFSATAPPTGDLFRRAMMDAGGTMGYSIPSSPTSLFSHLPPPCLSLLTPADPNLLPTTSLALSALHRRRRKISTSNSDINNDCYLKKSKPVPDEHKVYKVYSPEDGTRNRACTSVAWCTKHNLKDNAYWERRRKNNEAAKRSRDTRKAKEDEIALRAAYLEQENLKLKAQVNVLKNEMARLHCMLFSQIQS